MNEKMTFLPFHAINEFMRDDFRLSVIRSVLNSSSDLTDDTQNKLDKHINKYVKIPGFRHPSRAPSSIKLIPTIKAFEKNPELVATILSAWVETKPELKAEVYEMLGVRNWSFFSEKFDIDDILNDWRILPVDADRTKLPGFYTIWPRGETFETLYEAYMKLNPDSDNSIDFISLMVVWISMRLPYHVDEAANMEQENVN